MKRALSIAVISAFAFVSAPAFAAPSDLPASVKEQLKDLTKKAGAGEISSKEYNKRKQALLEGAQAQQAAEASKK